MVVVQVHPCCRGRDNENFVFFRCLILLKGRLSSSMRGRVALAPV
jgi:hypothetical protein